jgi:hypothetical protein
MPIVPLPPPPQPPSYYASKLARTTVEIAACLIKTTAIATEITALGHLRAAAREANAYAEYDRHTMRIHTLQSTTLAAQTAQLNSLIDIQCRLQRAISKAKSRTTSETRSLGAISE